MENKEQSSSVHTRTHHKKIRLIMCSGILVLCVILATISFQKIHSAHADTGGSFTQGVSDTSSNQSLFWFQPTSWTAGYVILHYTVAAGTQQNVNMTYNSGTARWEYTVSGLSAGQVISYSFTYQEAGVQYDTGNYTWTVGSGSSGGTPTPTATSGGNGTPTPTPTSGTNGTFPLNLQNNTHGAWADNQVYILVLGQATRGQWSYLKSDGTLAHINHLDADAPNHLTKNGVNYANMSFTLAEANTVTIPTHLEGARMYVSLGSPMYIPIASDDSGWGGPNLGNPSDPNADVYFDWYEFTYQYEVLPFGGNTTQVDMFGFPLTAQLQQTASGYNQTVGITLGRNQVYSQYAAAVGPAFTSLATPYRILAPHSSASFASGGSQANYMQSYIDQTWNYYAANAFTYTHQGVTFAGGVVNGQLQFTRNGAGPFFLNKPTSSDVLACSGPLASAGMTTEELELGADVCAAFNRGVALDTANWDNPTAYYSNSTHNDYAGFWHQIGISHRAYGFPYDDVNDQAAFDTLPNANPPSSLTIGIGW
jgi:hypothetical protein